MMNPTCHTPPAPELAGPGPSLWRNPPALTEPPAPGPEEELREMISVSRGLARLGADEGWVFALVLVCGLGALAACLLKLL